MIDIIMYLMLMLAIVDLSYGLGYVDCCVDVLDGKLEIDE